MTTRRTRIHTRAYKSNPSVDTIDKEEFLANTAISELISSITILAARKDPLIQTIKSPKLLIRGLTELQSMVEMVDIKHSIVNQIKFLITNHARKQLDPSLSSQSHSQFEGHMLHSVISGNPGTGKTTVAMILAKIWMALGFVNKKDTATQTTQSPQSAPAAGAPIILTNTIVNTINESYRKRVTQLEEDQRNSNRQMDRLREMLTRCQTTSGELRRQAIKLKPTPMNPSTQRDNQKDWDDFLSLTRELRFGFDDIIREANTKHPIEIISRTACTSSKRKTITIGPDSTPVQGSRVGFAGPQPSEDIDPFENIDPKFVVAAREDLIAEYLGQTAPKTKKVLESARGGVLFIDEAYSLCNMDGGSKDKYGEECLTTINEFMSLYPDEIIIIFAGYKDKLMTSIFKAQPGLMRRCAYFFEIKDYTINGLNKIFNRQLNKNGWSLDENVILRDILSETQDLIKEGGGGFTEKLAFFCKLVYGSEKFDETVANANVNTCIHDSVITEKMVHVALTMLRNSLVSDTDLSSPPINMYL